MKRVTSFTIVLCAVQFFCAALVFGQNGVIREFAGTVEIKRVGQTAFVPARAGDTVARDTIVSTGFRSTALITVGHVVLTVRPLTRLSLAEISSSAGTETLNVNLQIGRVRVDVDPPAGTRTNASVRGPSSSASVRGTSFEFDVQEIKVDNGIVAFKGKKGGIFLIGTGSLSKINDADRATDPIIIITAELLPPLPVGSDSGNNHGNASAGVIFAINLNFN